MSSAQTKLLSYSAWPAILVHMDPNVRIQFSRRCPTIRITDSSTLMKINTLTLNPLELVLNDTIYEVEFIRKNHVTNARKMEGFMISPLAPMVLNALPINFELKVNNLSLDVAQVQEGNPLIQFAENLIIDGEHATEEMMHLDHKKVHYLNNIRHFLRLLGVFGVDPVREIGTIWTCDFENENRIISREYYHFIDEIRGNADFVVIEYPEPRFALFRHSKIVRKLNRTSEVHISCRLKEYRIALPRLWTMTLEVRPRIL